MVHRIALIALLSAALLTLPVYTTSAAEPARVGTFDARAVSIAYYRSLLSG